MIYAGFVLYATAFVAGLLTFFASCLLPLVPLYLGYFGAMPWTAQDESVNRQNRFQVLSNALLFLVGFSGVFILAGLFAHTFGVTLNHYRLLIQKLAGVGFVLLALNRLGWLSFDWFFKEAHPLARLTVERIGQRTGSFLLGISLGVSWTPCIGPTLAFILLLASEQSKMLVATGLLFCFALGMGLPFVFLALGLARARGWLQWARPYSFWLSKVTALLILGLGLALWLGKYEGVTALIFQFLPVNSVLL